MKSSEGKAWYRGWAGFVVSVFLVALLFTLALWGNGVLNLRPSVNDVSDDLVTFSYHASHIGEAFTLAADVDLTDGMDEDEAIIVADALFNSTMGQHVVHQLRSAEIDELGIWTVEFSWGYLMESLGHWFKAEIDPFNRAIVYNRCR